LVCEFNLIAFLKHPLTLAIFQLLSVLGLAVCSIWYGAWYPDAYAAMPLRELELANVKYDFWDVSRAHLFNYRSPVPATLATIFFGILGGAGCIWSVLQLGRLKGVDVDLRTETDAHTDTKVNYHYSLQRQLDFCFSRHLDITSRVSIYSINAVDERLKLIYRFSEVGEWKKPGRILFGANEGVAGAVIKNGNSVYIQSLPEASSPKYIKSLNKQLECYRTSISKETVGSLRMKSRCYLAIAVREFESDEKVAVIVFESTAEHKFKKSEIEALVSDQVLKISLLVRHLTALDKDLNPFGGSNDCA
jgi:hypothetical protein